jgi:hypothetical protein
VAGRLFGDRKRARLGVGRTTITNPPRWSRRRAAIDVQALTAFLVGQFARHERAGPGIMQLDPDLQLFGEVRNGVAHLGLAAERADDLLVPFLPGVRSSPWPSSTSRIWAYFGNKARWVAEVYMGSVPDEV